MTYVGPDVGGVTLAPAAGGIHFPHGVAVEVPEKLGRSLLEQATFTAETPEKPSHVEARAHGDSTETGDDPELSEEADSAHDHDQG